MLETTKPHHHTPPISVESACTVASPYCKPAEPKVSALPDAQMKSFTKVIACKPWKKVIRRQRVPLQPASHSTCKASTLTRNWDKQYPKTPITCKHQSRHGRTGTSALGSHKGIKRHSSLSTCSQPKRTAIATKSAGRWHLLETVFHHNKENVAMLQGNMEIDTFNLQARGSHL